MFDIFPKNFILHHKVIFQISRYRKLLLSYSGGLDSTVLLDILMMIRDTYNEHCKNFPLILRVIHIHHGLSQHAEIWAQHCIKQCKIRNIPIKIIYINCRDIQKDRIRNVESLARHLRYKQLFNNLQDEEVLLTAHHMDDQVETFFLALKRGSGLLGLSGMDSNVLYNKKYRLLRPFLDCSRVQLENYANQNKLVWIEDYTNENIYFDRNFLRIHVLPSLCQRWPFFKKVVSRTTNLCRNQQKLLDELLSESIIKLIHSDHSLFFKPLFQFSILKRQALLRLWLTGFSNYPPSYKFINRIWMEVVLSKLDAEPVLRLNELFLCRRFKESLYVVPAHMEFPVNVLPINWTDTNNPKLLPNNLGLLVSVQLMIREYFKHNQLQSKNVTNDLLNIFLKTLGKPGKILTYCLVRSPSVDEKISIRFGHVDGLLYLSQRNRGRCLKKIWQELKIPPWLRSRIPLLFYNQSLIAAIGIFITKNGKIKNEKETVLQIVWIQDATYFNFFKNNICNYLK